MAATSSFFIPRSIRGQNVLSEIDRSRPFFLFVLSALFTFAILGAVFYIGLRVKGVNLGYRINQEIQNKERMIEENKRLSLEIARLKSPTRIETEAKEKLSLQIPQPHQIIYLGENSEGLDQALAKIKPGTLAQAAPPPAAVAKGAKKTEIAVAKKEPVPSVKAISTEKKPAAVPSKVSVTEKKTKSARESPPPCSIPSLEQAKNRYAAAPASEDLLDPENQNENLLGGDRLFSPLSAFGGAGLRIASHRQQQAVASRQDPISAPGGGRSQARQHPRHPRGHSRHRHPSRQRLRHAEHHCGLESVRQIRRPALELKRKIHSGKNRRQK
jgi:cell division protein FtsL